MREIKFRVWDKEDEKMLYDDDVHIAYNELSFDDKSFIKGMYLWVKENEDVFTTHNAVFMQYTGIKDKDGVEIYEGDIIKKVIPYSCYECEREPTYFEVFYCTSTASFELVRIEKYMDKNFSISLDEKTASHYYSVVGNIYENQKLLEEQL